MKRVKPKRGKGTARGRVRIIVEGRGVSEIDALCYAVQVVAGGRISNSGKQFCYLTTFVDGVTASALKNKGSDRIVVIKERK